MFPEEPIQLDLDSHMTVLFDPSYQSTLDAVYIYVVSWSEFPIVPSCPHICSAMVGVPHRPLLPSLPTIKGRWFLMGEVRCTGIPRP